MFDSSAKLPSGLLSGNINQFGNFDECLNAKDDNIQGQYCLAYLQAEIPPNFSRIKYMYDKIQSHHAFKSKFDDVSIN